MSTLAPEALLKKQRDDLYRLCNTYVREKELKIRSMSNIERIMYNKSGKTENLLDKLGLVKKLRDGIKTSTNFETPDQWHKPDILSNYPVVSDDELSEFPDILKTLNEYCKMQLPDGGKKLSTIKELMREMSQTITQVNAEVEQKLKPEDKRPSHLRP